MKNSLLFILLSITPLLLFSQNNKQQIAVLSLDADGVTESESITLTNRLRYELVKINAFTILERNKMDDILDEQGFQMSGCTSSECAVEAGQLLNVKQICSGSIGKIGALYAIVVRLIDVETGEILKTVSEDCECPLELVLKNSMQNIALKLSGKMPNTKAVRFLEKGSGDIFIKTMPAGAEIYFDGVKFDEVTPATLRNVAAGRHKIELLKGNLVGSLKIHVKDKELYREEIKLERAKSSIKIFSDPPEAEITLNGKNYGKTPTFLKDIGGGIYHLKVHKDGYTSYEEDVRIMPGEVKEVDVSLKKLAVLALSSQPSGADIFLNNENMGKTPLTISVTPDVPLNIKMTKEECEESIATINIKPGAYKSLKLGLSRSLGFVTFNVRPQKVRIELMGKNYKSEEKIELLSGDYRAKLSCSGYLTRRIDFNIRYNEQKIISRELETKTLSSALKRSFVPGWGQLYQEKTIRSWVYPLLFAGCAAGSYLYYQKYNDDLNSYNLAVENYLSAIEEDDIIFFRKKMDDAYDTAITAKNIRNVFYISTALVYLWNIADVLLLPPAWERKVSLGVAGDGRFYCKLSINY